MAPGLAGTLDNRRQFDNIGVPPRLLFRKTMCGICGELRFDGGEPDLGGLQRMMARLARRGPDHEGVYTDGPLAFGHRRLAIIDLSAHSDQPMVDKALGLSLVFNGTIYNYRELRA
jgi:asparagine synthase (glutamine-hydrolysing)